ncbi:MAG TPA: tetratricopeptide repeat protein [Steroidobacteraceae bacterium]|nr:tetratricopeptide repeat protein [Steroidobacteraceae bacterium]
MHDFDTKDLKRMFGIPASHVRSLIRAGYINPSKKAGKLSYSFQDLIVLRTLGSLRAAKIPTKKINRTLREIRDSLPGELPLSGLSIVAVGDRIVVREGQALRESDSGQYTLALEVSDQGGDLVMIDRRTVSSPASAEESPTGSAAGRAASQGADAHFERALSLEEHDEAGARAAYRECLALDAHHVEARVNLGRLLHLSGRLIEAESVYRAVGSAEPLLSFNLGVLLEDLQRESEAIAAYRDALAQDPGLADAHFNLARLHERAGNNKDALRHLLAYRRLMNEH